MNGSGLLIISEAATTKSVIYYFLMIFVPYGLISAKGLVDIVVKLLFWRN